VSRSQRQPTTAGESDGSSRLCPVCGSSRKHLLYRAPLILPDGYPLEGDYLLAICDACGVAFADYAREARDYERYYADFSQYAAPEASSGGGAASWDLARLREIAGFVARHAHDQQVRLLDIGCATGGLLRAFRELGYANVFGLDPSPACVQVVRESVPAEAWVGSIYEGHEEMGRFGLATLVGVLEHLEEPSDALVRIRDLLDPGGMLYVEVPDATRYADVIFAPYQELNSEHINHFSWPTLRAVLGRAGYEPVAHGSKLVEFGAAPAPAVFGLFRLAAGPIEQSRADRQLERRMDLYLRGSEALLRAMRDRLDELLPMAPSWIVWGTGQLAGRLLADTSLGAASIMAFVDNNTRNYGRTIRGVPILSPDQIPDPNVPILVASTLHEAEIVESARTRWGLTNQIYGLRSVVDALRATDARTSESARA
jgi:SAM-dependent methyltransferase